MSPARLPGPRETLRVNDLRRNKHAYAKELLASLSPSQLKIMDTVAHGGTVYGGNNCPRIVVSPNRKDEGEVIEGGMTDVSALVHNGWLRFAEMVSSGSGWFWMTDASQRLWRELGR